MTDLTEAERRMAREPGLPGRILPGQGLVFDEGYRTGLLLGILTDPRQAIKCLSITYITA